MTMVLEALAGVTAGVAGGQVASDVLGSVGGARRESAVAPTSSAAKPQSAAKAKSTDAAMKEAKKILWIDALAIVGAMTLLVFAVRFLDNVRIG